MNLKNNSNMMQLGVFLLAFLFSPVFITSLFFLMGGRLENAAILVVSLVVSIAVTFLLAENKRYTLVVCLIGIGIIVCAMIVSSHCYDWWWDGNTYHKSICGLLANGWNPIRESFFEYAKKFNFLEDAVAPWYDSYPKGTEIFAAVLYAATGNVEIGKAFNMIVVIAAFCTIYGFMREIQQLKKRECAIVAALVSINPIMCSQILTFYCDGFLYELLFLFVASVIYLSLKGNERYVKQSYFIIIVTIGLGLNAKFSGLIFFGLIGIAFFIYWIVKTCKSEIPGIVLRNRFMVLAFSVINAIGILGSNSYIINCIRHQNPVYPMIGKGEMDILSSSMGEYIKNKPRFVQVIISLFSKTGDKDMADQLNLKLPLSFDIEQIRFSSYPDTRIAGWGVFFSGIFILSIVVMIYLSVKLKENYKEMIILFMILGGVIFLETCVVTSLFWARYFLILFLFPAYATLLCFLYSRETRKNGKKIRVLASCLFVLCMVNAVPSGMRSMQQILQYPSIKAEMTELKEYAEKNEVVFKKSPWFGRFFNLKDAGIEEFTFEQSEVSEEEYKEVFHWGYQVYYRVK